MNVVANVKTNYDLNIQMTEDEISRLFNEIELLYSRSIASNTLSDCLQIIELKNLLTLSINNAR